MNCEKMINLDEIDKHSNYCFKIKGKDKKEYSFQDYITIINNKINNIYNYLSKTQNDKNNIYVRNFDFNEALDLILLLKKKRNIKYKNI